MSQEDDAFLMTSEAEDDLVIEEEDDDQVELPSVSSTINWVPAPEEVKAEMDRICTTPWYNLTNVQAEIIHRLVVKSENGRIDEDELKRSIESSLIELAVIRRNSASQH